MFSGDIEREHGTKWINDKDWNFFQDSIEFIYNLELIINIFCSSGYSLPTHGRSSHLQIVLKIGVLKNLAIYTGKHLCWSLLIKSQAFTKKESPTQIFSAKYCEIFQNRLFYRTPLVTASDKDKQPLQGIELKRKRRRQKRKAYRKSD